MRITLYPLPTPLNTRASETPPQAPRLTDLLKQHPNLQDDIDAIIEDRLTRGGRGGGGGGGRGGVRVPTEVQQELETLRQEKADRERIEAEKRGEYEKVTNSLRETHQQEVQRLKAHQDELLKDIRHDRCFSQLVVEATMAGAIDARAVATMLQNQVSLDDERKTIVLGPDGKAAYKGGRLVTLKDLVEQHRRDSAWAYKAAIDGDQPPQGTQAKGGSGTDEEGQASDLDTEIEEVTKELEKLRKTAMTTQSVASINEAKAKQRELSDLLAKKNKKGRK